MDLRSILNSIQGGDDTRGEGFGENPAEKQKREDAKAAKKEARDRKRKEKKDKQGEVRESLDYVKELAGTCEQNDDKVLVFQKITHTPPVV